jgi:ribonuclease PH
LSTGAREDRFFEQEISPYTENMETSPQPESPFRSSSRTGEGLREWRVTADIAPNADGSVLIATGKTQVICAVTIENAVPRWMKDQHVSGGWITAEYSMLPYSTLTRRTRDVTKGKLDGRGVEIQRLIGRALRVAIDLDRLGERTLWVDCDVLQADGGTRTAAITGGSIAITLACAKLFQNKILTEWPVRCLVGAVSAGIVDGRVLVDLDYEEDRRASVDLNLVMNSRREFIEIQGAGEEAAFSGNELSEMLKVAEFAISEIISRQQSFLQTTVPNLPEF